MMKLKQLVHTLILVGLNASGATPPRIVGIPPADAGRGLIRVSTKEIRHYPGKGGTHYLRSMDNGETWQPVELPANYPGATCLAKEAPAFVLNPNTREYLRLEPRFRMQDDEGIYQTQGGIDGEWIRFEAGNNQPVLPSGILRNPLWVDGNQRLLIPAHSGGCFTWYSDDYGANWRRSNKVNAPPHRIGGIHQGTRWNHGMVGATLAELGDGRIWMLARTARDQHYESFSKDYGESWSPARPSRFWGTITLSSFLRLSDGRLLLLWCNTTPLPERHRTGNKGGEDVFTNRDTIHAAISEDDGGTWIGFREIILDEFRNEPDYAVTQGSNDRGKHQNEPLQLDQDTVLLSCGQHPLHRRLMIMDLRWLYEKARSSDLGEDGSQHWSTHQYIDKIAGHCGYNRTPGPLVVAGALRILRVDDPRLVNPNQGATWNFPNGASGTLSTRIKQEKGAQGLQIALCDRWFNPSDPTVDRFANYALKIDPQGKDPEGRTVLKPGEEQTLTLSWTGTGKGSRARLTIDGQDSGISLPLLNPSPNGISYIHFYNTADTTDTKGFSIISTSAAVK